MKSSNDYISEKERKYQDSIVKLFTEKLGYEYLGKLQYGKDKVALDDGRVNSPIIEAEVRRFLSRPGSGYTHYQIEAAIGELKSLSQLADKKKGAVLDVNSNLYEQMIRHLAVQPHPDKPHENVSLFNFDNPLANNFAIAEEVSYIDPLTGSHSRPDIVVYVNGIALAVIELKRSIVSVGEGIKQHLSNQRDLIPSFFTTVQFTIVANETNDTEKDLSGFRYATIFTPEKFWTPWKQDNHEVGKLMSDIDSFLEFFDKETFVTLFRYGVIDDGGTKKVMRPHQYHALKAAMPRLKKKDGGVIWHSQGSGKSLTMVWLAKYIQSNFENPRVLVITDRTELDLQIYNTFLKSTGSIHRAKSSDDLLDTLQNGTEWMVSTLIHKFGRHIDPDTGKEVIGDDDAPIPLEKYIKELIGLVNSKYPGGFRTKGTHKFVFVDECHRTQSGRLHEAMRAIMGDDVMFIGFTGTPLLKVDKKNGYASYRAVKNLSENRFGEFIHKYLHKEAVDDKVILDLQYEARDVDQQISSQERLDEKFEKLMSGVNPENRQSIEDRWATLKKVYSAEERIERIGWSILEDMDNYPLNQDWCNAMLVAGDIYSAYRFYKFFQNDGSNPLLRDRCAVVTSYVPSDYDLRKQDDGDDATEQEIQFKNKWAKQSFDDAGVKTGEQYEAWAKRLFTKAPSRMKLLIVVDKLLTGFDAPTATYLYIDKDMRDHNLFQSICRVNRLGTDVKANFENEDSATIPTQKEYGMIVDFKHLFNKIEDAITNFNDEGGGFGGYDPEDIENLLGDAISKNKKRLELALHAYDAMKADWERQGVHDVEGVVKHFCPSIPLELPVEEHEAKVAEAKARREAFYKVTQALTTAYANIADYILRAGYSESEASDIHRKVSEAGSLSMRVKQASGDDFDVKKFDPQMRQLLDRFIRAEDAENIIPATADFSFLDLLTADSRDEEDAQKAIKEAGGNKKAAAEKIEAKARLVINDWNARDHEEALSFAARLQAIIDDMKKQTQTTTEKIIQLIGLLKAMKGKRNAPEGIETRFARSLWNNRATWTSLENQEDVVAKISEIEGYFATKVYAGWQGKNPMARKKAIAGLTKLMGANSTVEQVSELHRIAAANLQ